MYEELLFLKRSFKVQRPIYKQLIGPVPLMDVVLLLVLFFFTQSAYVRHPSIHVRLPEAAFVNGTPLQAAVVSVTRQGIIYFESREQGWDDLALSFRVSVKEDVRRPLIIEADRDVPHGLVVQVQQLAVANGFKDISIATGVAAQKIQL